MNAGKWTKVQQFGRGEKGLFQAYLPGQLLVHAKVKKKVLVKSNVS